MGFNCLKTTEPLRGDRLGFTIHNNQWESNYCLVRGDQRKFFKYINRSGHKWHAISCGCIYTQHITLGMPLLRILFSVNCLWGGWLSYLWQLLRARLLMQKFICIALGNKNHIDFNVLPIVIYAWCEMSQRTFCWHFMKLMLPLESLFLF